MTRLSLLGIACLFPLILGCTPGGPEGQEMTLEVAANKVDCIGEAPQRCLLVRGSSEEEWRQFYDRIEGFTHEEGFRYRIRIWRQRVANPLADASSYSYRLLEVLSKEPDGGD